MLAEGKFIESYQLEMNPSVPAHHIECFDGGVADGKT